jgi:pyruvate dehydrogenase E2 component (dihydrolipoamide acetyltransferase)
MYEVIMPKLGLTMETGVIEKWHKKEGDKVESGEVLFEVMTDKVSLEVEAYQSGYLRKILKNEGEEVPVTQVIAYIGEKDEPVDTAAASAAKQAAPVEAQAAKDEKQFAPGPGVQASQEESDNLKIKISPLARNIAESKGIDISKITGTGPGGRIVKEDVEDYILKMSSAPAAAAGTTVGFAAAPVSGERIKISPLAKSLSKEMGIDYTTAAIKGTGPEGRIIKEDILAYAQASKAAAGTAGGQVASRPAQAAYVPAASIVPGAPKVLSTAQLKGVRKVIAERMTWSKQNIPHITPTAVRDKIKDKVQDVYGVKITYTDFIIKACAIVLSEQPNINASLVDDNQIMYEDVNIALGVATDAGLMAPTIYGCNKISIFDIARKRAEIVEKAKAQKLAMEDISNATFTISNLGMLGVRTFTAIINPPQGAILMVGEAYKAPVVEDDKIVIRQLMEISVAVDHRIIDGADAAIFLKRLKEILESPELLLI